MFPADVTTGVVYIVRNPLDMAASVANHYGITIEKSVEQMCDSGFPSSDATDSLHNQLHQSLGSWSDHVRSWVDESGLPVHVMRYEDLRADTAGTFADIVRFVGLDVDGARITKAVDHSTFRELRRQETAGGFRERSFRATSDFFRKGEVGAWCDELSDELVRRLTEVNGETMTRFGYPDFARQSAGASVLTCDP